MPALIAEWGDRDDAYRWIARSLQLDLPLLIERPELVLACLYRRCFFFNDRCFIPVATRLRPTPMRSRS